MKIIIHIFLVSLMLGWLSGCGKTEVSEESEVVTTITITSDDRMRFEPSRFTVRAGDVITLTLSNVGLMPKETMGHNLIILDRSVKPDPFATASIGRPDKDYIAPEYADRVIAATKVLGPGEKETIRFQAPSEPGEYPFVCSFPGHTPAGMRGVMLVVK